MLVIEVFWKFFRVMFTWQSWVVRFLNEIYIRFDKFGKFDFLFDRFFPMLLGSAAPNFSKMGRVCFAISAKLCVRFATASVVEFNRQWFPFRSKFTSSEVVNWCAIWNLLGNRRLGLVSVPDGGWKVNEPVMNEPSNAYSWIILFFRLIADICSNAF